MASRPSGAPSADREAGPTTEPKPRGPPGMQFVPLPVPIAATLPPPSSIEPLLPTPSSSEREQMLFEAQERRRALAEAGQVLNRVVYDSMVFVPASVEKVPGGALLFESRFESGNLRRAVHVNGNEYDLLLNWDHGTRGHTQWYYFCASGAKVGETYRFNIVNFCKSQSLCAAARRHPLRPCACRPACEAAPASCTPALTLSPCSDAPPARLR